MTKIWPSVQGQIQDMKGEWVLHKYFSSYYSVYISNTILKFYYNIVLLYISSQYNVVILGGGGGGGASKSALAVHVIAKANG